MLHFVTLWLRTSVTDCKYWWLIVCLLKVPAKTWNCQALGQISNILDEPKLRPNWQAWVRIPSPNQALSRLSLKSQLLQDVILQYKYCKKYLHILHIYKYHTLTMLLSWKPFEQGSWPSLPLPITAWSPHGLCILRLIWWWQADVSCLGSEVTWGDTE